MPNADFVTKLAEIITEIQPSSSSSNFRQHSEGCPVPWVTIFNCIHGRGACKNLEGKRALFTPPMKDSGNRYMLVDVNPFIGKKVKARKSFGLCLKSR